MRFFDETESVEYRNGTEPKMVSELIAQRYMADNPIGDAVLVPYEDDGFKFDNKGRMIIDFDMKYPDAEMGSYAYAFGYFISDYEGLTGLSITLRSEAWIYIDGELITKTTKEDENVITHRQITFNVKKGKVEVFVKCRKNRAGFSAIIGTPTKWMSNDFYNPYNNILGMAYTGVYDEDIFASNIKRLGDDRAENWFPQIVKKKDFCENIDGEYYAVSYFKGKGNLEIQCDENITVYVDGEVFTEKKLHSGEHYVFLKISHKRDDKQTFDFRVFVDGQECKLYSKLKGIESKFLISPILKTIPTELIENFKPNVMLDKNKYWHTEYENIGVRVLNMSKNFGRWNYPLGVVMYGMTETGSALANESILNYVDKHMDIAARMFDYSRYDTEKYGFPCVMQQIADIDSLDDCGSFANAVLNYAKEIGEFAAVTKLVSEYILTKQERLDNGMF